jgi:flagellar biogenesis protein FliO
VDRLDVGARREIRIVRVSDRLLVVGITEDRMELLAELEEGDAAGPAVEAPSLLRSLAISS